MKSTLFNYKHKTNGHILDHKSFNRLPVRHHTNYDTTEEEPTHYTSHNMSLDDDNDDNITSSIFTFTAAESISNNYDSSLSNGDNSFSSDVSLGGGDFGGGGSSDSW